MNAKILYFLLCLTFFSCRKISKFTPIESLSNVTCSIFGQVVDENGLPLSNALVSLNSEIVKTDKEGIFQFIDISTSQSASLIQVIKSNYFNGNRTLIVTPNQDNFTKIRLIEKKNPIIFSSINGGVISVNGGGTVSFPSDAIIDKQTGVAYHGNVTVYSTWINPTDDDLSELIPGSLKALNQNGASKILQTFGMIGVELQGSSNQPLQLAPDKQATIEFPIPSSFQNGAPTTIPLWYFDEKKGMWIEEGLATLNGTNYVGNVSHFTFWNTDHPWDYINFKATIQDNSGIPIPGLQVKLSVEGFGSSASSWTNSNGVVEGGVPMNESIKMEVINSCKTVILTKFISTGSSNLNSGITKILIPSANQLVLQGSVNSCSNLAIKKGYVRIKVNDEIRIVAVSSNGNFVLSLTECSIPDSVKITAYDALSYTYGTSTQAIHFGINSLGTLLACGGIFDEYIHWTSTQGGVVSEYSITNPIGNFQAGYDPFLNNGIGVYDSISQDVYIGFEFDGTSDNTGIHLLKDYGDHLDSDPMSDTSFSFIASTIPVKIIQYGAIGEFVEGSFKGTVFGNYIPVRTVNCVFRMKRTY